MYNRTKDLFDRIDLDAADGIIVAPGSDIESARAAIRSVLVDLLDAWSMSAAAADFHVEEISEVWLPRFERDVADLQEATDPKSQTGMKIRAGVKAFHDCYTKGTDDLKRYASGMYACLNGIALAFGVKPPADGAAE